MLENVEFFLSRQSKSCLFLPLILGTKSINVYNCFFFNSFAFTRQLRISNKQIQSNNFWSYQVSLLCKYKVLPKCILGRDLPHQQWDVGNWWKSIVNDFIMDLYAQGNESISYLTVFRVFITDSWFNPGFSLASFHFIRVASCPKTL